MSRHKPDDLTEYRRQRVEQLLLRSISEREIVTQLAKEGIRNPETGEPFSRAAIQKDHAAIKRAWATAHVENRDALRGKHLAELEQVKRVSWQRNDTKQVLAALAQEADVLGLNAPTKLDVEMGGTTTVVYKSVTNEKTVDGNE